jgi:hypothetical protein
VTRERSNDIPPGRAVGRTAGCVGAESALDGGPSSLRPSEPVPAADLAPTPPGAADWPSRARQLQQRLAHEGLSVRVEARGALAIVVAAPSSWPADPTSRRAIVRAAVDTGFSHVAVELDPDPDPPALGDADRDAASPAPDGAPRPDRARA